MSFPFTSTPNPQKSRRLPPPFATPQSLSDWLKPRLGADSFGSWGVKPGTKNVHNLWLEVVEGETSLTDSMPPVRTVEVVIVRIIRSDGKVLIESHQELSNGAVRYRSRPLSEKMKPGESVDAAVFRAVKEELVDAEVDGLPEGEFCTEEMDEYEVSEERGMADSAVSCKKHYWKWVDSDSV
ncbi:hypothetical protein DH2020_009729 [Rehmannia glutinosa]|uniref:Uncharacterized protein n=1 Tax=Rehmannia glutinosa TaxID=99300 RepID=A0ABR0X762_REHGL